MAEAVTRHWLDRSRRSRDLFVASAGVNAVEGMPVTPETLTALESLGIDHSGSSKPLTAEMVRRADLVLCMTGAHVAAATRLVGDGQHAAKIHRLDHAGDLPDPIGMGQAAYDELAHRLQEIIPHRLKEMLRS
jgi:protein-tyrosine phosphatase